MSLAQYEIVPVGDHWAIRHDGKVNGDYATREAAYEAAAAAGSLALRQGHEVRLSVPGGGESPR